MDIKFDNVSLMADPFNVTEVTTDSTAARDLFMYNLARQRGSSLVGAEYKAKVFKLIGSITGATQADLDDHIDEFTELISRKSKNLDIDHGSGTRRYVATVSKVEIPRQHHHITYIPFVVEFVAPSGIGIDIAETTATTAGIATLINTATLTALGSARPKMRLKLNITSATAITKLEFLCNGDKITLTNAIVAGDEIIIDENTLKVTLNGTEMAYTGIFPQFDIGANVYSIQFTGTSLVYTASLIYTKTYL